jgi:hypothetical protein
MHRLLRNILGFLVIACAAPMAFSADNSGALPSAISAADPKSQTHVEVDAAAHKIKIRFGGSPAVSLTISQRWFLCDGSKEISIQDFEAQPVRKVSESRIAWAEQSRSTQVRLHANPERAPKSTVAVRPFALGLAHKINHPTAARSQ